MPEPSVVSMPLAVHQRVVRDAHYEADGHGGVAGYRGELLAALLAALLLQPLQGRDGYREQLDYDGGVDVRWMLSAKMVAIENEPPDMVFHRPRMVLLTVLK